jgi:flagellar protein FlbD
VIIVSRLSGAGFALNPDLIERAESTPDTLVTLVDGTTYVIGESLAELIELIRDYRAAVVASAAAIDEPDRPTAPVVRLAPRDS